MPASDKRKIAVTIDVEAQVPRAEKDHVNRLIWGKYRGPGFGISLMMDIADSYGIKLTHFLDLPAYSRYGEAIADVGREILRKGHDLQVHMHPESFGDDFYTCHSLDKKKGVDGLIGLNSLEYLKYFFDATYEAYARITPDAPLAFRGMGYVMTPALLQTLGTSIPISSTYNAAFPDRTPFLAGPKKAFVWPTGLLELPVSCINSKNGIKQYNFNTTLFLQKNIDMCISNHKKFLDTFYETYGNDAIAVFVMHSWSFFQADEHNFFSIRNDDAIRAFDAMLHELSKTMEFVTMKDVAGRKVQLFADAFSDNQLSAEAVPPVADVPLSIHACPLCGTNVEHFQDLFGGRKRQCPTCRSIERQRVFYRLWLAGHFGSEHALAGKRILHIAPSIPERHLFKELLRVPVVSGDIRPAVKPDMVINIAAMPEVPDVSFDVVFCSYVLTCTHRVHDAIKEIHRVLKPGGMLLCHDPLTKDSATVECDDENVIKAHYGEEALKRYDIGAFRRFGEDDYTSYFSSLFDTELLTEIDIPTGMRIHWLKGVKRPAVEHTAEEETPEHDFKAAMP